MPLPLLASLGIQAGTSLLGGLFGGGAKQQPPRSLSDEINGVLGVQPDVAAGSYGIANQYVPQYTRLDTQRDTTVRGAGVRDVAGLAGQVANVRRDYAPETSALLSQLQGLSASQLAGGGALSASELRDSQQQARSAWAARGLGSSPAAAVDEILNSDALRRRRMLEAQQAGLATVGLANQVQGDPFQTILGMNTQGYGQAGYDAANPLPLLGYAADLNNTNFNAAASAANASANNRASLFGAGISGIGNVLGQYYGGGG